MMHLGPKRRPCTGPTFNYSRQTKKSRSPRCSKGTTSSTQHWQNPVFLDKGCTGPFFLATSIGTVESSDLVTCGNQDNYNVSVRFRRDFGVRGRSRNNVASSSSKGPPGGNSTLMLAPLPGNHPQSVFQSVSLLFNYPFKPYNLLLRGTARFSLVPRSRFRQRQSEEEERTGENRARYRETVRCRSNMWIRESVGVTWDLSRTQAPMDRRWYIDIDLKLSRDKDGKQLCCEITVSRSWLCDTSSFSQGWFMAPPVRTVF